MNAPVVTEADLHAYLDRQLPAERLADVEAYLLAHPEAAQRLETYRRQQEALRQCFGAIGNEALPERLLAAIHPPAAPVSERRRAIFPAWSMQRIAAGFLIAALGGFGGWFGHVAYQGAAPAAIALPLPHQAAIAHVVYSPDARRPVEIAAEQEELLVRWLSKRLGTPVRVPKLGHLGYELVGGRLLPGNSGPVAQFMYQTAGNERMTLYISSEYAHNRTTGFRFAREGEINVFYWVDGRFGYALSGGFDKGELASVATAVYDQLLQP